LLETEPETRCADLSHLRQFFKWLQREGFRADDPTLRIMRPRTRGRLPRPIPEDDLALALAGARDRVRPWFFLGAYCGLRAGEIATLKSADLLELEDGPAIFVEDGKSSRQRVVPLPERIRPELGPVPGSGWMFRRVDQPEERNAAHLISHLANDELRSLGIDAVFHQLRHRYATQLYRLTGDLRFVQVLLGHASPVTTAGYAAFDTARARPMVDAL
jgi:integrase